MSKIINCLISVQKTLEDKKYVPKVLGLKSILEQKE